MGGGVKNTVKNYKSCFLVKLIFLFASLWNFDYADKILGRYPRGGNIVPNIIHYKTRFPYYYKYIIIQISLLDNLNLITV